MFLVKFTVYNLKSARRYSMFFYRCEYVRKISCGMNTLRIRNYSTEDKRTNKLVLDSRKNENTSVQTSVVENIKETTKTVSYLGIVLIGFGIAVIIIVTIFSELFSSKSPNRVYSRAFSYVANDPRVQNAVGDQIKGYGEETRRGRRQHISHVAYSKDGSNFLRMKFYIKGSRETGTVFLEMKETENGSLEYRYLFVVTDGLYKKTIILEDNRYKDSTEKNIAAPPPLADEFKELDLSYK